MTDVFVSVTQQNDGTQVACFQKLGKQLRTCEPIDVVAYQEGALDAFSKETSPLAVFLGRG